MTKEVIKKFNYLKLSYCGARYQKGLSLLLIPHHPDIPEHIAVWTTINNSVGCNADEELQLNIRDT